MKCVLFVVAFLVSCTYTPPGANHITQDELADNSVGTEEVINDDLTANDLAPNSVGNSELADTINIPTLTATTLGMSDNITMAAGKTVDGVDIGEFVSSIQTGTWTPTTPCVDVGGGSHTITTADSKSVWFKIGNRVLISGGVHIFTGNAVKGGFIIGTLPFTPSTWYNDERSVGAATMGGDAAPTSESFYLTVASSGSKVKAFHNTLGNNSLPSSTTIYIGWSFAYYTD